MDMEEPAGIQDLLSASEDRQTFSLPAPDDRTLPRGGAQPAIARLVVATSGANGQGGGV